MHATTASTEQRILEDQVNKTKKKFVQISWKRIEIWVFEVADWVKKKFDMSGYFR